MLALLFFLVIQVIAATEKWHQYSDFQYLVHQPKTGLDYWEAEKYCESHGGNLASIHSKDENNFISNIFPHIRFNGYNWEITLIGLRVNIHPVHWTDRTKVDYTNWMVREPNNCLQREQCTMLFSSPNYVDRKVLANLGEWNDEYCSRKFLSMVCKRKFIATTTPRLLTSSSTTTDAVVHHSPFLQTQSINITNYVQSSIQDPVTWIIFAGIFLSVLFAALLYKCKIHLTSTDNVTYNAPIEIEKGFVRYTMDSPPDYIKVAY